MSPLNKILIRRIAAILLTGLVAVAAVACGGDDEEPTSTPTTQAPTATPTTQTPIETPTSPSVAGDPQSGEQLFTSEGCNACHSTGSNDIVGPGLAGVGERADTRVDGVTADEYLAQSLTDPGAYVVDGFSPIMPNFSHLSDQEIADLTAYLKTLE